MTLHAQTDRDLIRALAESTRYVLVRAAAPIAPPRENRIPVNVAFVLDRSGSMSDERKFTLARDAVVRALEMLRPEDRFSLVVYDTRIDVLMPSTFATSDAKRDALTALSDVGPRGDGITNRAELAHHASELRRRGVATSTFGVGADFDERLLRDMAHEGGGNFYFIEAASQIPAMLTGELGEALAAVCRGADVGDGAQDRSLRRGADIQGS
jgi:Ca-activated chloride channel family protein